MAGASIRTLFQAVVTAGAHHCFVGIKLPNDASLALHRTFGFEEVGTMRKEGSK